MNCKKCLADITIDKEIVDVFGGVWERTILICPNCGEVDGEEITITAPNEPEELARLIWNIGETIKDYWQRKDTQP